MEFKEKFKLVRISKGLNQEDFGNLLGITQQTVSGIEKGTQKPSKAVREHFRYRYVDNLPPEGSTLGPGATILTGRIEPYGDSQSPQKSTNNDAPLPEIGLVIDLYEENRKLLKENRDLMLLLEEMKGIIKKHRPPKDQEEKRKSWAEMKRTLKIVN